MLPAVFTRRSAVHIDEAVVGLEVAHVVAIVVEAVTIGQLNSDVGVRFIDVVVILIGLVASALLLNAIDLVAVFQRQFERGAVLLARLVNLVVLHLILEQVVGPAIAHHLITGIPLPDPGSVAQKELKAIALAAVEEHGNAVWPLGVMDAEHAVQPPTVGLALLRGVYPRAVNPRAVGKLITAVGSVGRAVDVGIAEVEAPLEAVTVGIVHLAVADGAFQFLPDGVAKLPAAFIDELGGVAADRTARSVIITCCSHTFQRFYFLNFSFSTPPHRERARRRCSSCRPRPVLPRAGRRGRCRSFSRTAR